MKHVTELLEDTNLYGSGPRIGTVFVRPQDFFAHSNLLYAADRSAKNFECMQVANGSEASYDTAAVQIQSWDYWFSNRWYENKSDTQIQRISDWIAHHTLDVILSPRRSDCNGNIALGNLVMRAALRSASEGKRDISVLEILDGPIVPVNNWLAEAAPHGTWFAHELAVAHNIGFRYASPADQPEWPTVALGLSLHPQDFEALPSGYTDYTVAYVHHRIRGEFLMSNSGSSFESHFAAKRT